MLKIINIIVIFKSYLKIKENMGIIINDNIDAKDEYFLIDAVNSQDKTHMIPKVKLIPEINPI